MCMNDKNMSAIPDYREIHNAGAMNLCEMLYGEGNNVPDHFRKNGELRQIDFLCGYVIPRENEEKRIIRGLLSDRKHLVLGDIGSGKTTLLKKIGFKFMNDLGYEVLYIDGGTCFKNKRAIIRDIREMTGRDDIQLMVLFDNVHHSHEAANEIMNYLINKNIICLISSLNFQKDFSGNEICDMLSRFSRESRLVTKIYGESIQDEFINQMHIYTDDFTYDDINKKSKKFNKDVTNVLSEIVKTFPDYCKTIYDKKIQTETVELFNEYLKKYKGEKDIQREDKKTIYEEKIQTDTMKLFKEYLKNCIGDIEKDAQREFVKEVTNVLREIVNTFSNYKTIYDKKIQIETIELFSEYLKESIGDIKEDVQKECKKDITNVLSEIVNTFPDYCKTKYDEKMQTETIDLFNEYLMERLEDIEKDIQREDKNPTVYFNKNCEEIKKSSGGNLHKLKAIVKLIIHDPTLFSDRNNREFSGLYLLEHVRKALGYNQNDTEDRELLKICKVFSVLKKYGIDLPGSFLSELHKDGINSIEDSYSFLNKDELLWICTAAFSSIEHTTEYITDTFINHISKNQQEVHNVFKVLSNPDYIDTLMKNEYVKQSVKGFFRNHDISVDEIGSFMLDTYRLSRLYDGFIDEQVVDSTSVIIKKIFSENTSFESIFRFFGRLPWQNSDKKLELVKNNYKDSDYELCSQSVNFDSRPFKKGMMKIRESSVIDIFEDKNLFSEYIVCPMHTEADVCCICLKSRNFRTRESGIKLVKLIADAYCEEFAEKVSNSFSDTTENTDTVAEVYWIICVLNMISWIDESSAKRIYDGLNKKLLKDKVLEFYVSDSHPSKKDFVSVMYKAISGE